MGTCRNCHYFHYFLLTQTDLSGQNSLVYVKCLQSDWHAASFLEHFKLPQEVLPHTRFPSHVNFTFRTLAWQLTLYFMRIQKCKHPTSKLVNKICTPFLELLEKPPPPPPPAVPDNTYFRQGLVICGGKLYLQSIIMVSVSLSLASWNGGSPDTNMKRITPKLHTSETHKHYIHYSRLK